MIDHCNDARNDAQQETAPVVEAVSDMLNDINRVRAALSAMHPDERAEIVSLARYLAAESQSPAPRRPVG